MPRRLRRTLAPAALLWVAVALAPHAHAGWTGLGPDGGTITRLTAVPGTDGLLVATTDRGMFFASTDGGTSWRPATPAQRRIPALPERAALDPLAPSVEYRLPVWDRIGSPPLYVTRAGAGRTVIRTRGLEGFRFDRLFVLPTRPRTLLLTGRECSDCLGPDDAGTGLRRSSDGGRTWTAARGVDGHVRTVAADPRRPRTVYAGTTSVFRSDDGGVTWRRASRGLPRFDLRGIAVPRGARGRVFAVSDLGIHRSTDAGGRWTRVSDADARSVIADPAHPGQVMVGTSRGVIRSRGDGTTWAPALRGLRGTTITSAVAIGPAPARLLAAVEGDGVYVSADGGATWTYGAQPPGLAPDLAADPDLATAVLATTDRGVFRSDDGGGTWSRIAAPEPAWAGAAAILETTEPVFGQQADGVRYVVGDSSVLRSVDGGATWSNGARRFDLGAVTAIPGRPLQLAATLTDDPARSIARSDDGGATWRIVAHRPATLAPSDIRADPAVPGRLLAAVSGGAVWTSDDDAVRWRRIPGGPPALERITVNPDEPGTVYAQSFGRGLWRYTPAP